MSEVLNRWEGCKGFKSRRGCNGAASGETGLIEGGLTVSLDLGNVNLADRRTFFTTLPRTFETDVAS
jgi:hypothetical protein